MTARRTGGSGMVELFRLCGLIAVSLMVTAGITGFFGPKLRKIVKGPMILTIHRVCGLGAVGFGLAHGMIYLLYLR
jgi:DMSO/TMAO reductase YedYZ heme-binding membrane subunit